MVLEGVSCVSSTVKRPPQQKPATPILVGDDDDDDGFEVCMPVRKPRMRCCASEWRHPIPKRMRAGMTWRMDQMRLTRRRAMKFVGGGLYSIRERVSSGRALPAAY